MALDTFPVYVNSMLNVPPKLHQKSIAALTRSIEKNNKNK